EGFRVEPGERVVQRDVEGAGALRARRRVLASDAERDERLDGRLERVVGADGEEAAGDRGRHAAGAGDAREQRVAVLDGDRALAVGDVVDGAGHRGDDLE